VKRLASLAGVLTTVAIAVAAAVAGPDAVTIAAGPGIIRWPEGTQADGNRLVLQRFNRDNRVWSALRTIVFRNSGSPGWPLMKFTAAVPTGATLRLSLPRAQARPCYLGGYSNILQT